MARLKLKTAADLHKQTLERVMIMKPFKKYAICYSFNTSTNSYMAYSPDLPRIYFHGQTPTLALEGLRAYIKLEAGEGTSVG